MYIFQSGTISGQRSSPRFTFDVVDIGPYIEIKTNFGLAIQFDGNFSVSIELSSDSRFSLNGLCLGIDSEDGLIRYPTVHSLFKRWQIFDKEDPRYTYKQNAVKYNMNIYNFIEQRCHLVYLFRCETNDLIDTVDENDPSQDLSNNIVIITDNSDIPLSLNSEEIDQADTEDIVNQEDAKYIAEQNNESTEQENIDGTNQSRSTSPEKETVPKIQNVDVKSPSAIETNSVPSNIRINRNTKSEGMGQLFFGRSTNPSPIDSNIGKTRKPPIYNAQSNHLVFERNDNSLHRLTSTTTRLVPEQHTSSSSVVSRSSNRQTKAYSAIGQQLFGGHTTNLGISKSIQPTSVEMISKKHQTIGQHIFGGLSASESDNITTLLLNEARDKEISDRKEVGGSDMNTRSISSLEKNDSISKLELLDIVRPESNSADYINNLEIKFLVSTDIAKPSININVDRKNGIYPVTNAFQTISHLSQISSKKPDYIISDYTKSPNADGTTDIAEQSTPIFTTQPNEHVIDDLIHLPPSSITVNSNNNGFPLTRPADPVYPSISPPSSSPGLFSSTGLETLKKPSFYRDIGREFTGNLFYSNRNNRRSKVNTPTLSYITKQTILPRRKYTPIIKSVAQNFTNSVNPTTVSISSTNTLSPNVSKQFTVNQTPVFKGPSSPGYESQQSGNSIDKQRASIDHSLEYALADTTTINDMTLSDEEAYDTTSTAITNSAHLSGASNLEDTATDKMFHGNSESAHEIGLGSSSDGSTDGSSASVWKTSPLDQNITNDNTNISSTREQLFGTLTTPNINAAYTQNMVSHTSSELLNNTRVTSLNKVSSTLPDERTHNNFDSNGIFFRAHLIGDKTKGSPGSIQETMYSVSQGDIITHATDVLISEPDSTSNFDTTSGDLTHDKVPVVSIGDITISNSTQNSRLPYRRKPYSGQLIKTSNRLFSSTTSDNEKSNRLTLIPKSVNHNISNPNNLHTVQTVLHGLIIRNTTSKADTTNTGNIPTGTRCS